MFKLFSRKAEHRASCSFGPNTAEQPPRESPTDPQAQVDLVCQAVQKLEQVRHLVHRLPVLPIGNRQDLLQQLACTSDSLRALTFIDAVY